MAKPKYISRTEALLKLQRFCAYQERSHQEVRSKLLSLGIFGDDLETIMAELVEGGFLNEERFARTFARGKFRIKQWGKIRITQELKRRQISAYCIKKALEEIETEAYHATLRELLQKKEAQLQADLPPQRRIKLLRYALQKGYEPELIYNVLGE